jgi:hypothetical protein
MPSSRLSTEPSRPPVCRARSDEPELLCRRKPQAVATSQQENGPGLPRPPGAFSRRSTFLVAGEGLTASADADAAVACRAPVEVRQVGRRVPIDWPRV